MFLRSTALSLLIAALAPTLGAQWSSDPAANAAIASGAGDQVQPKVAATADGGCWVSWYDAPSGYDVRVQRLDADGAPLLAAAGVLVLDRGFSSTQDYGLDVDASGNALVACRDDSGANVQITAQKVTALGTLPWGAAGIQLTSTTQFVAAPKITGTSDGGAVVAWTQDVVTKVQKLDASGAPQWSPEVTLSPFPAAGSYSASDLHAAGNDAILAYVHQTGGFGSPRHLLAQKLDATGAKLWGAGGVAVFDGGSLQFGNFPAFETDGSGGAVFSWYDTAAGLQVFAQHVTSAGVESFPHNGSAGSTNSSRVRVSPSAAYDAETGEVVMFWTEQNSTQSMSGLYGQRFDSTGARQWGSDGSALVPLASQSLTEVTTHAADGDDCVIWCISPSFGSDQIFGATIDASGSQVGGTHDVSTNVAGKFRLDTALSACGFLVLVWQDDGAGTDDVLGQNLNPDGSLGVPAASAYCTAGTTTNGCTASMSGVGTPSASAGSGFDIVVSGVEGQKTGILFYGVTGPAASAWGMSSSFLCVKAPTQRTGAQGSGGTAGACDGTMTLDWNAYVAANPTAVGAPFSGGETVWAQGWFRDPPSPKTTQLSNGLSFLVCP